MKSASEWREPSGESTVPIEPRPCLCQNPVTSRHAADLSAFLITFPTGPAMLTRRQAISAVTLPLIAAVARPAFGTVVSPIAVRSGDWPWWRGPNHNGIAEAGQKPPIAWGEGKNIAWKTAVPGRSHGSPIVVNEDVVVTIADPNRKLQSVQCLDRAKGTLKWESVVHEGGLDVKNNEKSTMASTSAAWDGERYFVNFLNGDSVYMTALDARGSKLWQTKLTNYVNHQGFGSSPLLYRDMVIGVSDNKGGGAIVAMNRASGAIVWKKDRPAKPNYPSPVIFTIAGKEQLLLTGCDLVTSLNPATGETLWEVEGATTECVTTTVTDGQRIFTSGGYPKNHVSAVEADGSGKLAWENTARTYVPSMLCHDGLLFAVLDAGIAMCWDSATGKELWKGRLGGTFSSSPIMVNDLIYVTNEEGQTFVFTASRTGLELLSTNTLGTSVFSSPAICGSRIYQRIAEMDGAKRQEFVVCIAEG